MFPTLSSVTGHPRNRTTTGGPGDSIASYALSLANDRTSTFSRNIENFISCTKESRETSPQVVMRNMRQFMSGMKNYLVKHGEGDFQREVQRARSLLKPDEFLNLDSILEGVMHKLVVLPLREHLYGLFVDYYTGTGDLQLLVENVRYASGSTSVEFGLRVSDKPLANYTFSTNCFFICCSIAAICGATKHRIHAKDLESDIALARGRIAAGQIGNPIVGHSDQHRCDDNEPTRTGVGRRRFLAIARLHRRQMRFHWCRN